jgi:hypothetical protein
MQKMVVEEFTQNVLVSDIKLMLDNTFNTNPQNAWVSPSGDVYICKHFQHAALAFEIYRSIIQTDANMAGTMSDSSIEEKIEKLGWAKIAGGNWYFMSWGTQRRLGKRQIDRLLDWVAKYEPNKEMMNWNGYPEKLKDILEEGGNV